jgi:hypothetical protein
MSLVKETVAGSESAAARRQANMKHSMAKIGLTKLV